MIENVLYNYLLLGNKFIFKPVCHLQKLKKKNSSWTRLFYIVSESLSTEKKQLFKVEADLKDKITNLFNGNN